MFTARKINIEMNAVMAKQLDLSKNHFKTVLN